ncbi:MAG: hypothetical protein CMO80_07895 [Verrucomicrobiales bacterium]|nr:hypothetical protein [Verrucomicrobiales bacterium]
MKKILILLSLLCLSAQLPAQEAAPPEKAREIAGKLATLMGDLKSKPFTFELDLENPQAIAKGDRGIVIIPAKGLTKKMISSAGKDAVPVGVLWTRGVAPSERGSPADKDKFLTAIFREGSKSIRVSAFHLGIATKDGGRQELLVYGKSADPILRTRLMDMPARQDVPFEVAVFGGDDSGASLLLSMLGKFQAELNITLTDDEVAYAAGKGVGGKAAEAAAILAQHLNKFDHVPAKIQGDGGKADLFEKSGVAILVIPDKRVSFERLSATKSEIALGQLWMKDAAPEVGGVAAPVDEIKRVEIEEGEKRMSLPQFLLTARPAGNGKLELSVYSGGKEPLLTVPFRKTDFGQSLPIELDGEEGGPNRGILALYVVGKYYAEIPVIPE